MRISILLLIASTIFMITACVEDKNNQSKETMEKETTAEPADSMSSGNGLVTVQSNNSVDETYQNLVDAINSNEALSIIAELNHQANAANVDMELRPTRVLMFGNPKLGTPLMQNSQPAGIDLPQKFLVYEDTEGQVYVAYNKPAYVADRHGIEGKEEALNTIAGALQKMAEAAAK